MQSNISLSDKEWKIMMLLWEESPRTIMQLVAELKEDTGWAKATVITMLSRLETKGAVYYENGERAKLYYPKVEQEEIAAKETKSFLDKVYQGSLGLMINAFVTKNHLSKSEIDELYEILKKAEKEEK